MTRAERKNAVFMGIAGLLCTLSTCPRRNVGCVLTDEFGRILATGYNGSPRGMPHCLEFPCGGADFASGVGLDVCEAIHAEQNALLLCKDTDRIYNAYVTTAPCMHCVKMLLNTGCYNIYYAEPYVDDQARLLWIEAERSWHRI